MLRSVNNLVGFSLSAKDGEMGRVYSFLFDARSWTVRYFVVDAGRWLPGRKVLIAPEWVRDIGWEEREVWVDVSKQTIADSRPYDPSAPVNRDSEMRIYDYYGRAKYWA